MKFQNLAINKQHFVLTNDKIIRDALKKDLEDICKGNSKMKVIEELGITHGEARIDIAVVNGSIHGYELKSDMDTLKRLPNQIKIYNSVLDQVTLVVGKNHLYEAIKIIPEWWGITIAKITDCGGTVMFNKIREPEQNPDQNSVAVAALLWRNEALEILEKIDKAKGVRSKNREILYERLADTLDKESLNETVRDYLRARTNWRSDLPCMPSGD